jgi:hypothetical protein
MRIGILGWLREGGRGARLAPWLAMGATALLVACGGGEDVSWPILWAGAALGVSSAAALVLGRENPASLDDEPRGLCILDWAAMHGPPRDGGPA